MQHAPFKYARDAIERIDSAGFADWAHRKREALVRLAFAENSYELALKKATARGVITACCVIVVIDILLVAAYFMYYR